VVFSGAAGHKSDGGALFFAGRCLRSAWGIQIGVQPNKHFVADRLKLGFFRKAWFPLMLSFGG
jgi:hypothetical protein